MIRSHFLLFFPAGAIVLLDQVSKIVLAHSVPLHTSIPVIRGLFDIVHTRNRGMAFGFFDRPGAPGAHFLLIGATVLAIGILLLWYLKAHKRDRPLILPLAFVLGGACGNLIDRIRLGEVIDFLDVHVGAYHWPAFNVADAAITVGAIWLGICILLRRPGDPPVSPG